MQYRYPQCVGSGGASRGADSEREVVPTDGTGPTPPMALAILPGATEELSPDSRFANFYREYLRQEPRRLPQSQVENAEITPLRVTALRRLIESLDQLTSVREIWGSVPGEAATYFQAICTAARLHFIEGWSHADVSRELVDKGIAQETGAKRSLSSILCYNSLPGVIRTICLSPELNSAVAQQTGADLSGEGICLLQQRGELGPLLRALHGESVFLAVDGWLEGFRAWLRPADQSPTKAPLEREFSLLRNCPGLSRVACLALFRELRLPIERMILERERGTDEPALIREGRLRAVRHPAGPFLVELCGSAGDQKLTAVVADVEGRLLPNPAKYTPSIHGRLGNRTARVLGYGPFWLEMSELPERVRTNEKTGRCWVEVVGAWGQWASKAGKIYLSHGMKGQSVSIATDLHQLRAGVAQEQLVLTHYPSGAAVKAVVFEEVKRAHLQKTTKRVGPCASWSGAVDVRRLDVRQHGRWLRGSSAVVARSEALPTTVPPQGDLTEADARVRLFDRDILLYGLCDTQVLMQPVIELSSGRRILGFWPASNPSLENAPCAALVCVEGGMKVLPKGELSSLGAAVCFAEDEHRRRPANGRQRKFLPIGSAHRPA